MHFFPHHQANINNLRAPREFPSSSPIPYCSKLQPSESKVWRQAVEKDTGN